MSRPPIYLIVKKRRAIPRPECCAAWHHPTVANARSTSRGGAKLAQNRHTLVKIGTLALVSCATLTGGLVFSAAQALAAEGVGPVIGQVTATEIAEHEVEVEAQVDPGGLQTTYEVWLMWQEADPRGGPTNVGERPTGGSQTQTGHIPAGSGDQTVSVTLKGLQWGYTYWYGVRAVNSACDTRGQSPYTFALHISGEFPDGSGAGPPYETEISCGVIKLNEEESAKAVKEYEAKHAKELDAQHVKEHEEQESNELAARTAEATARKEREEQERDKGGLSLTATTVTVERNGTALVKLECLGIASCHGKLMLTAKAAVETKGAKGKNGGKGRPVTIGTLGTVGFSISGDETKTLKLDLDATGRALLKTDHGRCSASLEILELAPNNENTQTKTVQLVQQKAHGSSGGS
jgi:hypothetical protein